MTAADWCLAIGVNAAIVGLAWRRVRRPRNAADWQLAARQLGWPLVGLSLFATAIDSGDFVAVVGGAYQFGIAYLSSWWLGIPIGWLLATSVVLVPVYRAGFFTNAEYLEARFGPALRVAAAFVQMQQRTHVMGNMAYSLFLLLGAITGWGPRTWWVVVALAALAAAYTAGGGLRAVVATDSMQTGMIAVAAGLLWAAVWSGLGGWSGLGARLREADPELPERMLALGGMAELGAPLALVLFGWIAVHAAYCIVNHSQSMRLLGARSERDMRAAATLASAVLLPVMWCNVSLGIMGRALYPDLTQGDGAFPRIFVDYLGAGAAGLVLAGVLAACLSTYDSIGSALGAVFARDIFGRFLARGADDRSSLVASRAAAALCIAVSFCYVPFLGEGMVAFYLRLSSVAVVPLATVFAVGALTRAHRGSGCAGLAAGVVCGTASMLGDRLDWAWPAWCINVWWSYLWAVAVTAAAMFAYTVARGRATPSSIRGLTLSSCRREERYAGSGSGWLERSRRDVADATRASREGNPAFFRPEWITGILIMAAASVFWLAFD